MSPLQKEIYELWDNFKVLLWNRPTFLESNVEKNYWSNLPEEIVWKQHPQDEKTETDFFWATFINIE